MVDVSDLVEPLKDVVKIATAEELKLAEENYKKAEGLYGANIAVDLWHNFQNFFIIRVFIGQTAQKFSTKPTDIIGFWNK